MGSRLQRPLIRLLSLRCPPVSTDDSSIDPASSLNSNVTAAEPPRAPLTGQDTVVPALTSTTLGQLTVAFGAPPAARSCSSCLSTALPGSLTVPGLNS